MRAAVIREWGRIAVEEVPDPSLEADEVAVAVHAVSVNRTIDAAVIGGSWPMPPPLPHVPGVDPAGIVIAVGSAATQWRAGDRVVCASIRCGVCTPCRRREDEWCERPRMPGVGRWGGMAEKVALPARSLFRIPDGVDFVTASYAVRHGSLARFMLLDRARLRAGERVLVTGASGALGNAAVAVAAASGAKVFAAARAVDRLGALPKGAGVACYDGLPEAIDVVVETTGVPEIWQAAFARLADGGRLIGSAASGQGQVPLDLRRLYRRRLAVGGASLGGSRDAEAALTMAAEGRLAPRIAGRFGLEELGRALAFAGERSTLGKVIIQPQGVVACR